MNLNHEDWWAQELTSVEVTMVSADFNPKDFDLTDEEIHDLWFTDFSPSKKERVPITSIDDLGTSDGLIDGGYLSFVYGSRPSWGNWNRSKFEYQNYLMVMDHPDSIRARYYPKYKSHRREKRKGAGGRRMQQIYEQVQELRKFMNEDIITRTTSLQNCEADDIIALLTIFKPNDIDHVIAQDKDFFQVPHLGPLMVDNNGISQFGRGLKLPKYALEPNRPSTWALTQAVFGDRSDDIPRLLPSKGWDSRREYEDLVKGSSTLREAYLRCYNHYGQAFIRNLRLVLLPHPWLLKGSALKQAFGYSLGEATKNQDLAFLELVYTDQYWKADSWEEDHIHQIFENIERED